MATTWKAPTWRMPNEKNQSKFESYSIDFNGMDPLNCGNSDILNIASSNYSISTWVKYTTTNNQVVCEKGSNNQLALQIGGSGNQGKISWIGGADYVVTSANAINDGNWHHVCCVAYGSSSILYIDGQVSATGGSKTQVANTSDFMIGGRGTSYYFTGSMSQLCLFDYDLSSTQVSSLYNSGSPINPMTLKPAPIAYYPLGGNASTGGNIGSDTLSVPNVAVPDASVFDFDGSDDKVNLEEINLGITSTVSMWINPDTNYWGVLLGSETYTSNYFIQARYNDFFVRIASVHKSFPLTDNVLTAGDWHHLVVTRNGDSASTYVNGNFIETKTGYGTTVDTKFDTIGSRQTSPLPWEGKISNISAYNSVLNTEDITTLYNNGQPLMTGTQPQEANLKAWYKLNQSANWEADTVGNWQIPDNRSAYPQSFDFDGSSSINFGDSDDFSFGDSVTDSPFSISVWVNKNSGELLRPFNKYTSSSKSEYNLVWAADDIIYFALSDLADSNRRGRKTSAITSGLGEWNHIVATYDGSGGTNADDGIKIYLNKTRVDNAYNSKNNYTAMHNTNSNLLMQQRGTGYGEGKISNAQIYNIELSSTQVETLYNNGAPLTTAIATDNLKGWWKLDNNEKFDRTNWSVENQKYPANWESALYFDGTQNDNVFIGSPSAIQNLTNITLSVWIKVPNTFSIPYYTVASKGEYAASGSQWYLTIKTANSGPGGTFAIYKTSDSTSATTVDYTTNIDDNKWHNIVCINDGTDLKVYIDGQLDGTNAGNGGNIYNGNRDLKIGRLTASSIRNFDGLMSNMVIWGDSQETEINNIYNNGTPATSYTNTPVAWWKLNNTTTGIQDSVGSNNGTNNGATKVNTFVSTQSGISSGMTEQNLVNNNVSVLNGESSGMDTSNLVTSTLTRQVPYNSYSLYFDGTSDYVEVPDDASLKPTSAITCSMWFNCGTQNTNRHFLSKYYDTVDGAYGFYTNGSSSDLYFYVTVGSTTYDSPVGSGFFDDNWHHAVGVYDGANIYLYVDGVQQGTSTAQTGSISYNNGILCFASLAGAPTSYEVDTYLNNISIFNEALTSTEILKLYNSGVPSDLSSFNPQPVSWWSLGSDSYFNGTNYICPDLIGTNNSNASNGLNASSLVGDAPNSSANGTSTNMTIDANLTGSAPNSSNNSFSVNMSYDDRVSGSGDVPG